MLPPPPHYPRHPPSSFAAHNLLPSICCRRARWWLWTPAHLSKAATAPVLRRRWRCPPAAAAPFRPLLALISGADDVKGSRVAAEGAACRRQRVAAMRSENHGRARRAAVHPSHLSGLSIAAAAPRGRAVSQPAVLRRRSPRGGNYSTASTSLSAESRAAAATPLRVAAVSSSGGRESLSPSRPPTRLLPHS